MMIITIITSITINIIVSSGAEYITVASSLQGPVRPTAFPTQAAQQSPSETCSDAARCCLHFFQMSWAAAMFLSPHMTKAN
jgi:hypothetical protein